MKKSILRSDDQLNTAHFISVTPLTIAVFNYFYAHFDILYSKMLDGLTRILKMHLKILTVYTKYTFINSSICNKKLK